MLVIGGVYDWWGTARLRFSIEVNKGVCTCITSHVRLCASSGPSFSASCTGYLFMRSKMLQSTRTAPGTQVDRVPDGKAREF